MWHWLRKDDDKDKMVGFKNYLIFYLVNNTWRICVEFMLLYKIHAVLKM